MLITRMWGGGAFLPSNSAGKGYILNKKVMAFVQFLVILIIIIIKIITSLTSVLLCDLTIKTQRTQGIASLYVIGLNAQNIYIKTYWPYRIYMHLYVPIWPDIFLQNSSAMRALRAV